MTRNVFKPLVLSLLLHLAVISAAVVFFTGKPVPHQELLTVFLAEDEPAPGLAGKAVTVRSSGAASPLEACPPAEKKVQAAAPRPAPSTPMAAAPLKQIVEEKTTVPQQTVPPAPTMQASAQPVSAGGSGDAGGTGRGGAESGTGAGDGTAGEVFGAGGGGSPGGGSGEGQPAYMRQHYAYIKEIINKNLQYPPVARKMGWQGVVQITFVVLENGFAESIRISKSSGHSMLDQAVVKAVRKVQPFPKPPARAELTVPVLFRLEDGAGAG